MSDNCIDSSGELSYLEKLRALRAQSNPKLDALYQAARKELENKLAKPFSSNIQYICQDQPEDVRKYIVERFLGDGVPAELHTGTHELYNGDIEIYHFVKVSI